MSKERYLNTTKEQKLDEVISMAKRIINNHKGCIITFTQPENGDKNDIELQLIAAGYSKTTTLDVLLQEAIPKLLDGNAIVIKQEVNKDDIKRNREE